MSPLKKNVLSRFPFSVTPPSHDIPARITRPGISARVGEARRRFAGVCVGVAYDCSVRRGEKRAFGKGTRQGRAQAENKNG